MWTLCFTEWKASGSQKSQTLLLIHSLVCLHLLKKVSNLEDSINSSPRSTSLGWWGDGWKSTYKGHGAHVFLKLLLMKEYQGHMSFFQACIIQQEDTAVHPKTLDIFIWRVGRRCKRFKENLIFEILIQYHLHNWVRKMKIHMDVTWEERKKVKLKWGQNCTQARWGLGLGWTWNLVKVEIFKKQHSV